MTHSDIPMLHPVLWVAKIRSYFKALKAGFQIDAMKSTIRFGVSN